MCFFVIVFFFQGQIYRVEWWKGGKEPSNEHSIPSTQGYLKACAAYAFFF